MRKYLCYLLITFCVMFLGMMGVKAASSSFERVGNNYRYRWQDLPDMNYTTYTLNCSGGSSIEGSGGNNGGAVTSETGYVILTPSGNSLSCQITNGSGVVVTQSSININSNTTTTTQTPQTTQSTTTTTQARSNNNNLSSISLTTNEGEQVDLSPSFSPSVYTYSATVASTAKTVSVDARMEDSRANLTINGDDDELVAGENNRITITVTAEDGTPRTYTINVTREALTADATLSELSIKESKSFKLEENKYTYNVKIGKNVKTLTLDYTPSDENATVEVDGNENLKDGSKVRITVTAEDGTKRVYTLNIVKETTTTKNANTDSIEVEKNPLIIMGLSVIAFGLIGGIIYVIKK